MELIDTSLMKENKLLFKQAKKIYLIMKNIPRWKKELCKLSGEEYDDGLDKILDHVIRNAIDYAGMRAKFAMISDAEAMRRNNEQIAAQNIFLDCMTTFLEQGKCFATPEQEDMLDHLDEKQLGDLAAFIAYTYAMNAR
jgi:5-methylthioribose kinase